MTKPSPSTRRGSTRSASGNMIVLTVAVTLAIVTGLLFFALKYTRLLGAHQEQQTAIESAALAVVNDLSRIVYDDPNFGLVGLADYAPVAPNTVAQDSQNMPVRGINSLLGTVRLDMILADQINDSQMKLLAMKDYTNATSTRTFLVNLLQQAVQPGGAAAAGLHDVDGQPIDPYADGLTAYRNNIIRMTGSANSVDASSLKISLGCFSGTIGTNIPVPQPLTYANLQTSQEYGSSLPNGTTQVCYKAYVDCPYDGHDFVFAPVDSSMKLVDTRLYVSSLPSLPYVIPGIAKVEADQVYADTDWQRGPTTRTVHCVACAAPGSAFDQRGTPGALKLTFPNGSVPELTKPGDFITSPKLSSTSTLYSPQGGDYPPSALAPTTWPGLGGNPVLTKADANAYYDWLRRDGPKANVGAVLAMLSTPFSAGMTSSTAATNVYSFNLDGTISYQLLPDDPSRQIVGSQNQGVILASNALSSSNGNSYDVNGTDAVAQPGRLEGGQHGGEPLSDASLAVAALTTENIACAPANSSNNDWPELALALLLPGFLGAGLYLAKPSNKRAINSLLSALLLIGGSLATITLCACSAGPPPAPKIVTTANIGPRVPRASYVKNGMACEIEVRKH